MSTPKKPKVTRKFLLDLANRIYDPKKKTFLRLCRATLSDGPDPKNKKRTMHCGLGELYYAVVGHDPFEHDMDEEAVVRIVFERSTLAALDQSKRDRAAKAIKAIKLTEEMESDILDTLEARDIRADRNVAKFTEALDHVVGENDDGVGDDDLDYIAAEPDEVKSQEAIFQNRAKKVAAQLRKAAALLPS